MKTISPKLIRTVSCTELANDQNLKVSLCPDVTACMPRSTSTCSGFTLIELVAVIVTIGILAAVAAPRFVDFSEDARRTALLQDVKTFESAIFLYRAKRMLGDNDDRESASSSGSTGSWSNQQWVEYSREQLQDYIAVWPDTTPYGGVYAFRFYDGTEGNWITNWRHIDTDEQLVTWTNNPDGLNFQPFELLMLRFTDTGSGESDQAAEEKVLAFLRTTPLAARLYRYGSQSNIAVLMP